jgi:alanine racemase
MTFLGTAKRVYAEINLSNLKHNILEIRKNLDKNVLIMGVVKADAYGHGALEVSRTLIANGVERLAVATIDEAILLRENGINVPVQILGAILEEDAQKVIDYNIIPTVPSVKQAAFLSSIAVKCGKKLRVHIKVDTGMGRLGFFPDSDGIKQVIELARLPNLELEGIMTHFSSADGESPNYTLQQYELFMEMCEDLKKQGIEFQIRHVANSAATLKNKDMHLEMVRPGLIIYGLYPEHTRENSTAVLKPVMSLKSRIVSIKKFPKESCISYGRSFKTSGDESIIGVVSAGYADGYWRALSNRGHVLINGEPAPIVGTICMDCFMVDLTEVAGEIYEGQEVILMGRSGNRELTADMLAELCKTISYEIVCRVGKRVDRVYV